MCCHPHGASMLPQIAKVVVNLSIQRNAVQAEPVATSELLVTSINGLGSLVQIGGLQLLGYSLGHFNISRSLKIINQATQNQILWLIPD